MSYLRSKHELHDEGNLLRQLRYLDEVHKVKFIGTSAKCPKHDDKIPSLYYYSNKSKVIKFKCFGCPYNEDIFGIIRRFRECSFPEAYKEFAEYCGERE